MEGTVKVVQMAMIPKVPRMAILYLALSLSQLAIATYARTLYGHFSPLTQSLRNLTSLTDPQTLRCFTSEEAGFPVDKHVCAPVIKSIHEMRASSRAHLMRGIVCPIVFDAVGTPCQITLIADSPEDEDRFSKKDVAEVALRILNECEREKFGGVGILGTQGFAVKVNTPLEGRLRPLGTGRYVLKESRD